MARQEYYASGKFVTRHGLEATTKTWLIPDSLVPVFKVLQNTNQGVMALAPDESGRICLVVLDHMQIAQNKNYQLIGYLVGSVGMINGNPASISTPDFSQPIGILNYLDSLSEEQVEETINEIMQRHLSPAERSSDDDQAIPPNAETN